jgi:hypothetical protein
MRPLTRLHLRPRSAYDILALVAFFIAVAGGGAYAAATIGAGDIKDNAVHSNHILNGAVQKADLAANSVGSGKVNDGTLLRQDFKAGTLGRGAVSLDVPVGDKSAFLQGFYGLKILFRCPGSDDPSNPISLRIIAPTGSNAVLIGTQNDRQQHAAAVRFVGQTYDLSSNSSLDLDVMAELDPDGKWVHLQLTGYWSGSAADGCQFGGLLTPPSN